MQNVSKKDFVVSQPKAIDSPQKIDSPVFNNEPTALVQNKLQPQTRSSLENKLKKQPESALNTVPKQKAINKSPTVTDAQVNSSFLSSPGSSLSNSSSNGKRRQFNLSGVSQAHSKRSQLKGRKSKPKSKDVSLNSSCMSELSAIPDSLPIQPPRAPTKKPAVSKLKTNPLPVKRLRQSFACEESDDDLDQCWKPTKTPQKTKKLIVNTPKKTTANVDKRRKNNITNKSTIAGKSIPKPAMTFKSQLEKQQFIDEVYGDFSTPNQKSTVEKNRKRVIDSVYDDINDANFEAPQTKIPKSTSVDQKKTGTKRLSKIKPTSPSKTKQTKLTKALNDQKEPKTLRKPLTELSIPPQNIAYGSKNYQKQPEVNNNAFDEMVSNYHCSKRYCTEQDHQVNKEISCPIKPPKKIPRVSKKQLNQITPAKKHSALSPVTLVMSPLKVSSSSEQSSSSHGNIEELSIAESTIKDQVMNTETTETAIVPQPPIPDPLNVPPSPSVSVHSSQITADLDITSGFHKICRALISKSGTGIDPLSQVTSSSFQAQSFPEDFEEVEEVESIISNTYTDPDYEEPNKVTLTLTQLARVSPFINV